MSARPPVVALVHDSFTGPTGMGLVLERHAEWILAAGWELWLVGDNVPEALRRRSRVVRVPKPSRIPSLVEHLEWCRRVRRALRGVRADLVHGHAPLLAAATDLFTSHFISRPAHKRGIREDTPGLEGALRRMQGRASLALDDAAYRRLAPHSRISFVSEFLRDEYRSCYGEPRGGWILPPPAPAWRPPSPQARAAARRAYGTAGDTLVVGFVGGTDPRKGFRDVLPLSREPDIELLLAGPRSETVEADGRRGLGFVDMDAFLPACDVVVAPSRFDSAPVAVLQALAKGIPVVSSSTLGWAQPIERHGSGVIWDGRSPLADAVRTAATVAPEACRPLVDEFSAGRQSARLLDVYRTILDEKGIQR